VSSLASDSPLILGSGSISRARLLRRLGMPFEVVVPGIDEAMLPGESVEAMVLRLGHEKALAVAARCPHHWIIASDQVLSVGEHILGKPENEAAAVDQLMLQSGREAHAYTSLVLYHHGQKITASSVVLTRVVYRAFSLQEARSYVALEKPFDAAGGLRVEGRGIALLSHLASDDPTALEGLPLIRLAELLRKHKIIMPLLG
jgi:septum formation protein